jgi:MFS family permease
MGSGEARDHGCHDETGPNVRLDPGGKGSQPGAVPPSLFEDGDRAGIFSAVRHKRVRPLWTASILSGVAYMTALTACGWVAFDLHHHSSTVGVVVFAFFLPSIIITPFAGVLADRYDRRTMLLTMNVISLVAALELAWFTWTGSQSAWPLVVAAFILGASRMSSTPTEQAMLGSLVPARDLLSAVALLQANLNGARLLGPLLAAPLLHVGGSAGAFLGAAALSAMAFWQIWSLGEVPHQRSGSEHNPLAQLSQGVRYVCRAPVLFSVIALVFLHCGFTMGYDAALPRRASDVLGPSGTGYSLLMMAIGGGSLVGTVLLAGFARRVHYGYLFFATGILSGLTLVPLGYAVSWPGTLIAAAAVGLTQSVFIALATTVLQIATPDHVRGRVLALYWGSGSGVMGLSNLAVGRLADEFGTGPMLALPGLVFIAVTVLTLWAPTLREIYGQRVATATGPSEASRLRPVG